MGYWEQIGEDNRRALEARRNRRGVDWGNVVFWTFGLAYCALFWFVLAVNLWRNIRAVAFYFGL